MKLLSRIDINQPEIVLALRNAGASVELLHRVGAGCPDLLVGIDGVNYLIEIKNGNFCKSAQALTPKQKKWHSIWKGQLSIATSPAEAIRIIKGEGNGK